MRIIYIFPILLLSAKLYASDTIYIGSKYHSYPDIVFEDKISHNSELSLYDAFEYEVLGQLIRFLQNEGYHTQLKKVNISSATKELIRQNSQIDILINNFSITSERVSSGINYSPAYFLNRGIGVLISKDYLTIDNYLSELTFGYIENTRSEAQIHQYKRNKNNEFKAKSYSDYEDLYSDYENGVIQGMIGDITVLLTTNLSNPLVIDFFPTKRSRTGDRIAIGIHKQREDLVPLLSNFVNQKRADIDQSKQMWLGQSVLNWKPYQRSTGLIIDWWAVVNIAAPLLLLLFLLLYFLWKKGKKVRDMETGNYVSHKLSSAIEEYITPFEMELSDVFLARRGIKMLNDASEDITYVGSGGFMNYNDEAIAKDWRNAIYGVLNKKNIKFQRIIDMPSLSELIGMRGGHRDRYITDFFVWLYILYYDLKTYKDTLKVWNTRGAAQWGYGLIVMVKDKKECLVFTLIDGNRVGTYILSEKLGGKMKEMAMLASNHSDHETPLDRAYLENNYFLQHTCTKETMQWINELLESNHSDRINEKQVEELKKQCELIANYLISLKK